MAFTSGFHSKGPSRRNRKFECNGGNGEEETEMFERDEDDMEGELAAEHRRIMRRMQRDK